MRRLLTSLVFTQRETLRITGSKSEERCQQQPIRGKVSVENEIHGPIVFLSLSPACAESPALIPVCVLQPVQEALGAPPMKSPECPIRRDAFKKSIDDTAGSGSTGKSQTSMKSPCPCDTYLISSFFQTNKLMLFRKKL